MTYNPPRFDSAAAMASFKEFSDKLSAETAASYKESTWRLDRKYLIKGIVTNFAIAAVAVTAIVVVINIPVKD